MLGDFRCNITVDLDDLYLVETVGQFADVFISNAAIRVPFSCKVDNDERKLVASQVVRHQWQLSEIFDGCEGVP